MTYKTLYAERSDGRHAIEEIERQITELNKNNDYPWFLHKSGIRMNVVSFEHGGMGGTTTRYSAYCTLYKPIKYTNDT